MPIMDRISMIRPRYCIHHHRVAVQGSESQPNLLKVGSYEPATKGLSYVAFARPLPFSSIQNQLVPCYHELHDILLQCRNFSTDAPRGDAKHTTQKSRVLELLHQKYLDIRQLHKLLNTIYHETDEVLEMNTFHHLVSRVARLNNPGAAKATQGFLGIFGKFHKAGRLDKPPEKKLFGLAMQSFSRSNHPKAGEMAEEFLIQIETMARQGILPFPVSAHFYAMAMKPYAIRGQVDRAQAIFDRCIQRYEHVVVKKHGNKRTIETCTRPDAYMWAILIDAYAKSGRPEAGFLATLKLKEMRDSFQKGLTGEPPNHVVYGAAMNAWAQSKCPQEVEELLEEMYNDYEAGNDGAKPTTATFNVVLKARAQTKTLEGARRSEAILNRMHKLSSEGSLPVQPNNISYRIVAWGYGLLGMPMEAELVLKKQHDDYLGGNLSAEPEARCFSSVLMAWSRSKEDTAGEEAECILDRMEKLYADGQLKERPNAPIYDLVIKCWGAVGKPEEASKVFERMMKDYTNGNMSAKPTQITAVVLLTVYFQAKLSNAGELADDILDQLARIKVEPNAEVLMAAKQCWNCSIGHAEGAERRCFELQGDMTRLKRTDSDGDR